MRGWTSWSYVPGASLIGSRGRACAVCVHCELCPVALVYTSRASNTHRHIHRCTHIHTEWNLVYKTATRTYLTNTHPLHGTFHTSFTFSFWKFPVKTSSFVFKLYYCIVFIRIIHLYNSSAPPPPPPPPQKKTIFLQFFSTAYTHFQNCLFFPKLYTQIQELHTQNAKCLIFSKINHWYKKYHKHIWKANISITFAIILIPVRIVSVT